MEHWENKIIIVLDNILKFYIELNKKISQVLVLLSS